MSQLPKSGSKTRLNEMESIKKNFKNL
jgi:hypothetical protein